MTDIISPTQRAEALDYSARSGQLFALLFVLAMDCEQLEYQTPDMAHHLSVIRRVLAEYEAQNNGFPVERALARIERVMLERHSPTMVPRSVAMWPTDANGSAVEETP